MNFSAGGRVWLQGLYQDATDEYVDPVGPSVDIVMPNSAVLLSAIPNRMSRGAYNVSFDLPSNATLGEWTARWTGIVDGAQMLATETFTVVPYGQGETGHSDVEANLTITRLLLAREGNDVVLSRPPKAVSDGEGGVVEPTGVPLALAAQRMFVSGVTRDSDYRQSSYIVNEQGEKFVNRFVIIGMPDLDILQGDEFAWHDETIKIDMVHEDRRWQTKAEGERVTNADG